MLKIIINLFILVSLSFSTSILPTKAKLHYKMDYTKDTTCLIRHLKVYKYPRWIAKIELKNGKKIFFSSPKSMFEFYFNSEKWLDIDAESKSDFKNIIVTDYETLKPVNAKDTFFIYGSRVISPGGDDLVAIKDKQKAKLFAEKYNGKRILKFNEVSDALIRLLNGRI